VALTPGTRVGVYEVTAQIGVGGMGEVYRAKDTKLNRDVALKILPEAFATDPDRLARFQREAKTLASLNHPYIGGIHGLEESNGVTALVMELVEGEDLAQHMARGAIPLDEAVPIARQIAEALEAAHEQGIIHRDLKPANIKVRPDGTVKVLDFGLAKALERVAVRGGDVTASPTITSPAMTEMGIILGTAAYMSPEQAKGRQADRRSDVWAFGCVLYEMLTGTRAFEGEDVSDTLANVLKGDPDWNVLPADVPVSIRTLLKGCLAKDRRHRIADLSAALFVIDHQASLVATSDAIHAPAPRVPLWQRATPVAALIVVALVATYSAWMLRPAVPRRVTRFAITLPAGDTFTPGAHWLALSPDGARLAYTANNRLYLRARDQLDAVPIVVGDGPALASPRSPFFSPDGQSIGFWQASQLMKVSVSGGAPVPLCAKVVPPYGATWAADDTILVGDGTGGIWRVPGNGGTPETIIKMDAGQRAHGPQLLPDGRTVLFTVTQSASWDEAQIVVQSLESGIRKPIITGGTDGRYLPTGHLVYMLRQTVLAVPFDTTSLTIRGTPVPMIDGVRRQIAGFHAAQFAVSLDGTLAYVPSASFTAAPRTLVWVDRRGREEAIAAAPHSYSHPRLDRDGTRLALEIQDDRQNWDIWVWDFVRGTLKKLTSSPTINRNPIWTPDGQRIIFVSNRTGVNNLFWQAANGTGTAEPLIEDKRTMILPHAMSPDGNHLVLRGGDGRGGSDLMILDVRNGRGVQPLAPVGEPRRLVATPAEEHNAEISPNGQWLAYQSNRSGVFEVYVRPFPDVESGEWLVSTAGGTEPLWAHDSRELFYRGPKGAVMRVSIAPGSWKASTPTRLFDASSYALGAIGTFTVSRTYDVSPDGQKFLMIKPSENPAQSSTVQQIVIVQNWFEELKAKVPTK
jgi:serine/threonine-protein kinase